MDILTVILLANQSICMYGPFSLGRAAFTDLFQFGASFCLFFLWIRDSEWSIVKVIDPKYFFLAYQVGIGPFKWLISLAQAHLT